MIWEELKRRMQRFPKQAIAEGSIHLTYREMIRAAVNA